MGLNRPANAGPIAHTRNQEGNRHSLSSHLHEVARLSATFAEKFDASNLGFYAGLWHDIGKIHPDFQRYLLESEAGTRPRGSGPDHKAAGAKLAMQHFDFLVHPIAGHHGGLRNQANEMLPWLTVHSTHARLDEAIEQTDELLGNLAPAGKLSLPSFVLSKHKAEFFIRMLFSALVDADFLDTEAHFEDGRSGMRGGYPALGELWQEFDADQAKLTGPSDHPVNQLRHSVYLDCLKAASQSPGFFRLTVPTGGGKTRSGLAFALRHAIEHDLDRVIFAIPYTSITDQTATVYREIFSSHHAILEHHSALTDRSDKDGTIDEGWERLAAENWDAPIVVTTTVQLFESLLGRSTTACRKLHNIAHSVIVLDEVQTLPPQLLDPILDVLRELVANYGVTVVLSTATQPALDERLGFPGLPDVRDLVDNPRAAFELLRRVEYELPGEEPWTWERVADEMRSSPQCLTILNTRADALAVLDALDDPDALHLSTLLCGAHRRNVLEEVRRRLKAGEPCRLVSTQVVEAGVDIDFPLVLRALGPLDRIVQAAGRCNREGLLERGRVVIFQPAEGGAPRGVYETGIGITEQLLRQSVDLHDPAVYEIYFQRLFTRTDLDAKKIQNLRGTFNYTTVAERFRLIPDDTESVVVPYRDHMPNGEPLELILNSLKDGYGNPRFLWRALQPFTVSVRRHSLNDYAAQLQVVEVVPGLWRWLGVYDEVRGIMIGGRDPTNYVL